MNTIDFSRLEYKDPVLNQNEYQNKVNLERPFYFLAVFWGSEYRQSFLDNCLASLLSENNIPALANKKRSKLILCTSKEDWFALQDNAIIQTFKHYLALEWIELDTQYYFAQNTPSQAIMSQGHKLLSSAAFTAKAYGVFLIPDVLFAESSIKSLQNLVFSGKYDVIEIISMRFATHGLLKELKEKNFIQPGKPISITAQKLIEIAIKHRHSEMMGFDWMEPFKPIGGNSVYFPIKNKKSLVFHTASFMPLLVNYGALCHHDTSTFDNWTLDGDYIAKNFQNENRIYVSHDTDEMLVLGFTDEAKFGYPLFIEKERLLTKLNWIHNILQDELIVKLWRKRFPIPIKIAGTNINAFTWQLAKYQSAFWFTLAKSRYFPQVQFFLKKWYQITNYFTNPIQQKMLQHRNHVFMNTLEVGSIQGIYLETSLPELAYWEIYSPNINKTNAFLVSLGITNSKSVLSKGLGSLPNEIGFCADGTLFRNGIQEKILSIDQYQNDTTFMFAYNKKLGLLWIGIDGKWLDEGNPSKNLNPTFSQLSPYLFPAATILQAGLGTVALAWKLIQAEWHYIPPKNFQAAVQSAHNPIPIKMVTSNQLSNLLNFSNIVKQYFDSVYQMKPSIIPRKPTLLNTPNCGEYYTLFLNLPIKQNIYLELHSSNMSTALSKVSLFGLARKGYPLHKGLGLKGSIAFRSDGIRWQEGVKIDENPLNLDGQPISYEKDTTIFMIAFNKSRGRLWIGINGCWLNNGDPNCDLNPSFSGITEEYFFAVTNLHSSIGTATLTLELKTHEWHYLPPTNYKSMINSIRLHTHLKIVDSIVLLCCRNIFRISGNTFRSILNYIKLWVRLVIKKLFFRSIKQ